MTYRLYEKSEARERIYILLLDGQWRSTGDIYRNLGNVARNKISKILCDMLAAKQISQDKSPGRGKYLYTIEPEPDGYVYVEPHTRIDGHPLAQAWTVAHPAADLMET